MSARRDRRKPTAPRGNGTGLSFRCRVAVLSEEYDARLRDRPMRRAAELPDRHQGIVKRKLLSSSSDLKVRPLLPDACERCRRMRTEAEHDAAITDPNAGPAADGDANAELLSRLCSPRRRLRPHWSAACAARADADDGSTGPGPARATADRCAGLGAARTEVAINATDNSADADTAARHAVASCALSGRRNA